MPLIQQIDFKNGVVTEDAYIRVSNLSINFNQKTVSFAVETYLNKACFEQGLLTIIPAENFFISDNNMSYPIIPATEGETPQPLFTNYFSDPDLVECAENYILTIDKYKTAVKEVIVE